MVLEIIGCRPRDVKTRWYNTFVWPIMEYASCVWDPTTKKNITKVESVQRSAARYIMNNYSRDSSVNNMLSDLEWKSLHHQRAASKVTMLYRIINRLVDIPDTQLTPSSSNTRGNSQKFLVPATRTTLLKGSSSQTPSTCGTTCPRKLSFHQPYSWHTLFLSYNPRCLQSQNEWRHPCQLATNPSASCFLLAQILSAPMTFCLHMHVCTTTNVRVYSIWGLLHSNGRWWCVGWRGDYNS